MLNLDSCCDHMMRQFKLPLFITVLFLLLVSFSFLAYARDIEVSIEPIKDTIFGDQTAIFNVTIQNNQLRSDNIRISSLDIEWDVNPSSIKIDSNSEKTIEIRLMPVGEREPGINRANIVFSSLTDQNILTEHLFKIKVIDPNELLLIDFELPSTIDPNEENLIRVILSNKNDITLDNITLELKTSFFEESRILSFEPFEEKTEFFVIGSEQGISEGMHDLTANIYYNGELYVKEVTELAVGYGYGIVEVVSPESGFLVTKLEVTKANNGNITTYDLYRKEFSSFEKFFTSSEPEPDTVSKEDGYYVMEWEFNLSPGEVKTVVIETNYTWFLIGLIALVLAIVLVYLYTQKDIVITKKIGRISRNKEGISTFRVMLNIKNKRMRVLRNVKVMDRLHGVHEIPKDFGTIKPNKVIKKNGSAELIWYIPHLGRGEEIVISYKLTSKIDTIGKLHVPVAHARYSRGKRSVIVTSNKVKLFS